MFTFVFKKSNHVACPWATIENRLSLFLRASNLLCSLYMQQKTSIINFSVYDFFFHQNWEKSHLMHLEQAFAVSCNFVSKMLIERAFTLCHYHIDGFDLGCCYYLISLIHPVSHRNRGLRGYDHQPMFSKQIKFFGKKSIA